MKTENLYTVNQIRTFTGIYINPFNPHPEEIVLEDIAHHLANQCRFGGAIREFYSVAQHSWMVSAELAPLGEQHALAGLFHDAAEAYLLDIPSPVKAQLPGYKEAEDRLMVIIAEKFGFEYPLHTFVKAADKHFLELEWQTWMLGNPIDWPGRYSAYQPLAAKRIFLQEFKKLTSGRDYRRPDRTTNETTHY